VEGRQAVRELLLAGRRRCRDVWLGEEVETSAIIGDILELAAEARVTVRRVSRGQLDAEARSEAPQGVLAHADPLPETELDRLCTSPGPGGTNPFLVCMDGITDPQNLGALLRTAACAGATGVVLPRHRAAHVTPTVAKAAAGAVEHLDMAVVSGLPAALARASDLGVWVVGLDADGDTPLFDLGVATEPVGLVLGAEGQGLGRLTRTRCDVVASIPLRGPLASLNVAAAGALACFEVARRRLQPT
jgi:23S rRNA (guanosine2251-2'-O)-methyltransferase